MKQLAILAGGVLAVGAFLSGCSDPDDNLLTSPVGSPTALEARGGGGMTTFHVTIENLTDGQPFSPPVAATHDREVRMFEVGEEASDEIEAIAEDGNDGPLADLLRSLTEVTSVVQVGAPLTPQGVVVGNFTDTVMFEIQARPGDRLSLATMLICTNDGITGLDAVRLPFGDDDDGDSDGDSDDDSDGDSDDDSDGDSDDDSDDLGDGGVRTRVFDPERRGLLGRDDDGDSDGDSDDDSDRDSDDDDSDDDSDDDGDSDGTTVFYLKGYDAGTEDNTERSVDIVDACGALGPVPLPEDGNENDAVDTDPRRDIKRHRGIEGEDDLSEREHDWDNPVARVTVMRISP